MIERGKRLAWLGLTLFGAFTSGWAISEERPGPPTIPGNGSGGGGNVIVAKKRVRVADSAYRAPQYQRFYLTSELRQTLLEIQKQIRNAHLGWFVRQDAPKDSQPHTFFDDEVFRSNVEYRLVEKLPGNCRFVEDRDVHSDPSEQNLRAGCTFGSVTYLLQSVVKEALDDGNHLELALLIMHERLFPFTRHQESYEVISEFVQGLRILMLNYAPREKEYRAELKDPRKADPESRWVKSPPRIFDEEELEIVNRLPERIEQLTGAPVPGSTPHFTAWGGQYRRTEIDPGVILGIGADVESSYLKGRNVVIVDHTMSSGFIDGTDITIVGGTMGGTALPTSVHGTNINIINSQVKYLSLTDARGFTLENTRWESYVLLPDTGRGVRLRDCVVETTSTCNNYFPGPGFTVGSGWLGSLLRTDGRAHERMYFSANCTLSERELPGKAAPSPISHPVRN